MFSIEKKSNDDTLLRSELQEMDDAHIAISYQVMKLMEEVQNLKKFQKN